MIGDRLRSIRALPPRAIGGRPVFAVTRRWHAAREKQRDLTRGSFAPDSPEGALHMVCDPVPRNRLEPHRPWIERAAVLFADHRFDLLGSGWVRVAHGTHCKGTDGVRYDPAPAVTTDPDGRWLDGRINPANREESRRLWQMIDPGYTPIDWQLDFRSGFRWREDGWSGDIRFGDRDGVDVKLPWELARMQHLFVLAWAHRLSPSPESGGASFVREFRNQVLDFMAANPPRFGVNWCCAMDVAIRAANWIAAYGLFRAHGAAFDQPFEAALARSLVEHGRHIVSHLEFYPEGRSNHYLADIAGLLFIAACLPQSVETDGWLAFAIQELVGETAYQFNPDGSNFEGSTSYHRLSLELATYATALVTGLPQERLDGLSGTAGEHFRSRPNRPLACPVTIPGPDHAGRLQCAAAFAGHVSRPDGTAVQIGDNDNGRFLKPHPVYRGDPPAENQLDHQGVIAAVRTLMEHGMDDGDRLDGVLAGALARGRTLAGEAQTDRAAGYRIGSPEDFARLSDPGAATAELVVPGGRLCDGLALYGYPDFGLWIFHSARLFLTVRCGPVSSPRAGGSHAHNDQLAIDLTVDGEPWITDPGSYLYCPPLGRRNRWRSVTAHAAPQWPGREPGRLDLGAFRLRDNAKARCLYFGPLGFAGEHRGYGAPVRRRIALTDEAIVISDSGLPNAATSEPVRCVGKCAVQRHFAIAVPCSPGYGEIQPTGAP